MLTVLRIADSTVFQPSVTILHFMSSLVLICGISVRPGDVAVSAKHTGVEKDGKICI